MKSLLLSAINTGHPVFTRMSTATQQFEPVVGVLPEIMGGIDQYRVLGTPAATAFSAAATTVSVDLGDDIGVADPMRAGARRAPRRCG